MGKSIYNKEYQKSYREKNKEHIRQLKLEWYHKQNPTRKIRSCVPLSIEEKKKRDVLWTQRWEKKHPEYVAFTESKRRAYKLKATPKWADLKKIREIYKNCPTGFHVDHIIPLQGKYVTGLHVPENLQYLSATENYRKSNHYERI